LKNKNYKFVYVNFTGTYNQISVHSSWIQSFLSYYVLAIVVIVTKGVIRSHKWKGQPIQWPTEKR
jgi:hypothetical protein